MKYSIIINQKRALEWELTTSEAVVFSWIYELASWAEKLIYDNKTYYFSNRTKACEELPIVSDKPDTMYRIFKSLEKKGLISMVSINKKDYIALTEKGKLWHYDDELPNYGKKSEESRKEIRENSENFPTDKYNNNNNNKETSTNVDGKKDETSSLSPELQKFNDWMINNAPYCYKNMKPLTDSELKKLKENYTPKEISCVIEQIENRKDLRKRYTNLYRTVLNWAKKEYGKK